MGVRKIIRFRSFSFQKHILLYMEKNKLTIFLICPLRHRGGGLTGLRALMDMSTKNVNFFFLRLPLLVNHVEKFSILCPQFRNVFKSKLRLSLVFKPSYVLTPRESAKKFKVADPTKSTPKCLRLS